jgi:hypothetical protein
MRLGASARGPSILGIRTTAGQIADYWFFGRDYALNLERIHLTFSAEVA